MNATDTPNDMAKILSGGTDLYTDLWHTSELTDVFRN